MSKHHKASRKETEATKFLEEPSQEGAPSQDVSEGESKAIEASEAAGEPSREAKPQPVKSEKKPAVKAEALSSEIPGKFRKFQ